MFDWSCDALLNGHDEAGGRGALDQAFAEIFGAESAIVRSQVRGFPLILNLRFSIVLSIF